MIITPKNLLRLPQAKSPLAEFDEVPDDKGIVGVRFKRVIMDESATDRSVFCHDFAECMNLFLEVRITEGFAALLYAPTLTQVWTL